jgi:hypothetical protein
MKRVLQEEAARIACKQVYLTERLPGIAGFKVYNIGDVDVFYIDCNNAKIEMVVDGVVETLNFQQDLDKQSLQDIRNVNLRETFNKSDDYVKKQTLLLAIKNTLNSIVTISEMSEVYRRFKHLK